MAQSTVPINTLVDKQEEQFFPVTHVDAVIDSNGNPVSALLAGKQPTLISGSNIKSINNQSLLGSGNLTISSGSDDIFVATYGTTTGNEIWAAHSSGKKVLVCYNNIWYTLVNPTVSQDDYLRFESYAVNSITDLRPVRRMIVVAMSDTANWAVSATTQLLTAGDEGIFVATYGTTTGTEIANAVSQNKLVVVKYGDIMYTLVNGWHNSDTYSFEAFFNHPNTGNFTRSVIHAEDGNLASWQGPTDSVPSPLLFQGSWNHIRLTRNGGNLIPGAWYRITDYVATVTSNYVSTCNPDVYAQSANHPFDILVLATSTSSFSEEARAVPHDGDTYFVSDSSEKFVDMNAWKIWYCLDNDTERFDWADSQNGKGVIYRMIDEFNNDCPYDFKGIVLKKSYTWVISNYRSGCGWLADCGIYPDSEIQYLYFYTFSKSFQDPFVLYDATVYQRATSDLSYALGVHDNYIAPAYFYERGTHRNLKIQTLNDNIFVETVTNTRHIGAEMGFGYNRIAGDCTNNYFAEGCYRISLAENCCNNSFNGLCRDINLSYGCYNNRFEFCSADIQFGPECNDINLYGRFDDVGNAWEDQLRCSHIVLGANNGGIHIYGCTQVRIGNRCSYIRIEKGHDNITIGNECNNVTIQNGWFGGNIKIGNFVNYVAINGDGQTGTPSNLIVMDNLRGTSNQWMSTGTYQGQGTNMNIMGPISGSPGFVIRKFDVTVFPIS